MAFVRSPPRHPRRAERYPFLQRIVERAFDGQQLHHSRNFSGGAARDGSGPIAAPRARNKMQPELFYLRQSTTRFAMPFFILAVIAVLRPFARAR
jgi:hypothetical protein